jgi:plastocyanin
VKRFGIIFTFVALFVIFMTYAACDKHPVTTPMPPPTPTATSTPITVNLTGNTFSPDPVTISAGGGVRWFNQDPWSHYVQASNIAGTCGAVTIINGGASGSAYFSAPSTIYVHCQLHSWNCLIPPPAYPCDATCTGMVETIIVQ